VAVSPRRRYSPRLPREQRREQILDACLRLLSERGFAAASMEGVAREADIAKTVVYDTFGTREGMLRALFAREQERSLEDIAGAMPADLSSPPLDLLVSGLTTWLQAVRRNPERWRLILLPADGTPPAVRAAVDRSRAQLLRQVEPMVAWGLDRLGLRDLDAELAAQMILGTSENAARLTLTAPRRYPPERLAAFARQLAASVLPRPG
jgi:AcrR family transcriptional regulator